MRAGRMFERISANGDGQLSASDVQRPERAASRFARLDADGNGTLSQAEFEAARETMRGPRRQGGRSD